MHPLFYSDIAGKCCIVRKIRKNWPANFPMMQIEPLWLAKPVKNCTIYLMLLSISAIPQLRSTHSAKQTTFPLRKSQKIFPFNECMTEPGNYFMPIWTCIFCSLLLSNHWQADEELKDAVEGLNPDAEKHESYIDIEPVSIKIPWAQNPNLDSFYLRSTGYRDDARSQGWTTVSCCCLTINWWFHMTMPLF